MTRRIIHTVVLIILVILCCAFSTPEAAAKKFREAVFASIHLSSGEVMTCTDSIRIEMPQGKKQLRVIANPYTARQKCTESLDPALVDSIVIWNSTTPDAHHTLAFLPDYGWCWQLDRGKGICIYAFSPKGYHLAGNGGMWTVKKSSVIVVKNGVATLFTNTSKPSNAGFRKKVAAMIPEDPMLARMIENATGRRDKILRMLAAYSPPVPGDI